MKWPFGRRSGSVLPSTPVTPPMPPVAPPRPSLMLPMGDGGAGAFRLMSRLMDALGHLSGLQQGGHVMADEDIERCEELLVTAACEIYTGLTGVPISPITTYRKMDAIKAEREAAWHASKS